VVTVAANATDSVGVTKVEFWLDGQLKASDTSSPYGMAWDSTTVADAGHSWTARAFDAAGNVGSASVAFTTANTAPAPTPTPSPSDTTPPSVAVTSHGSGSTVSGAVTVSASASDNVGVTKVEFWLDGQMKASATSSPYAFARDSADGGGRCAHTWTALAFDAPGNAASASVTFTVSNAPPPNPDPQPITETFSGKLGGRNQPSNRATA